MATTTAYNFIAILMADIQGIINSFILNGYEAVMLYVSPALLVAIVVFVSLVGVGLSTGHIEMSRKGFFTMVFKIALVWTLATNWGFVSKYIVNFLQYLGTSLGQALVKSVPQSYNVPGTSDAVSALQIVGDELYNYGHTLLSQGGITSKSSLTAFVEGVIIWGLGIAFIAIALFELILAQLGQAILFVLTPFVALFLLVPWSKGVFERWAGSLVGYTFMVIMIYAVLALCCNVCYQMLPTHDFSNLQNLNAEGFFAPVVVLLLSIGFLLRVQSTAMHIGGGAATSSGMSMMAAAGAAAGGFMGGMAANALKGFQGLKAGYQGFKNIMGGGGSASGALRSAENEINNLRTGD